MKLLVQEQCYNCRKVMPSEPKTVRVLKLKEQDRNDDLKRTTPAQRLAMMWQLTMDAWPFKVEPVSKFQGDAVRVIRLDAKNSCHF